MSTNQNEKPSGEIRHIIHRNGSIFCGKDVANAMTIENDIFYDVVYEERLIPVSKICKECMEIFWNSD
jgi:hypothetical protein